MVSPVSDANRKIFCVDFKRFITRDAMIARYMLSSCVRPPVRPSVRPSITSRSSTKMVKP